MLDKFIAYLNEQVKNHSIYVWGAQGQKPTKVFIEAMEKNEIDRKRALARYEMNKLLGYTDMRAYDCSGLGMYWLQNLQKLYTHDMTADDMKRQCTAVKREELKRGDWVFRIYAATGKAYHIGYVVDDGYVIEAKGRDDGVVKRKLDASGKSYWNAYGRPKIFTKKEDDEMKIITRTAKKKISDIYDAAGKKEKGRYIAKGDKCLITNVMTDNLLIPVEYPVKSGTHKAFIRSLVNF